MKFAKKLILSKIKNFLSWKNISTLTYNKASKGVVPEEFIFKVDYSATHLPRIADN
jgi:hypothetical protein